MARGEPPQQQSMHGIAGTRAFYFGCSTTTGGAAKRREVNDSERNRARRVSAYEDELARTNWNTTAKKRTQQGSIFPLTEEDTYTAYHDTVPYTSAGLGQGIAQM